MEPYVIGGREEVFVADKFLHVMGKMQDQDAVGHGLGDFFSKAFTRSVGVYVQGTEFREVCLNVALVPELTKLQLDVHCFPRVPELGSDSCGVPGPHVPIHHCPFSVLVPGFHSVQQQRSYPGDFLGIEGFWEEPNVFEDRFPPDIEGRGGFSIE